MPSSLGPAEILIILVIALIVLGPKKLPEAGRQLGRALSEVRQWSHGIQRELRDTLDAEERAARPAAPSPGPVVSQPAAPQAPPDESPRL